MATDPELGEPDPGEEGAARLSLSGEKDGEGDVAAETVLSQAAQSKDRQGPGQQDHIQLQAE